ncbi:ABC transporter permease [Acuticoccus sp. M5D2P5]|uniref:ABC transporter permease n=1 Tax=Acuticoccus kalidii TaxID=2910977 RepID=UPI001F1A8953|nr:ABC transporter permease [Acuticoccus kalidii]MCF3931990.1 ABC transporter permease [Acuticoccus kalidii]
MTTGARGWSIRARAFDGRVLAGIVYPLLAIAIVFGLWEGVIRLFDVPVWLVPKPSDFLGRFATELPTLAAAAWATSVRIFFGFLLGVAVAVPLALALVSIPALERGLYPVIVFLNIMPKTVIGPILIVWFGIGPMVAVLIVFLMCFFPVLVDAMSGFRAVDPRLHYITRSMGATSFQTFRHIRLPASMPHIYSGMRIGIIKAVEGVIIAEFIASNAGLGHLIMRASSYMDMPLMFCGLIATAIVALIFNAIMTLLGRVLMPWARRV